MTKILSAVFFLLLSFPCARAADINNPLPNWIDGSREHADGKPPVFIGSKSAPPSGFRIPAEYEPVGAVVIGWAGYTSMLSSIARAAAASGAEVWAVDAPASISGVPPGMYEEINARINTVWMRDYGPFGLNKSGKAGIVDTVYRHYQYRRDDDALPANLGMIKSIKVYAADIILDGGNFMVDSYGNLFMTKRTYSWNSGLSESEVNARLKSYFKVRNIYAFDYAGYPGYPSDGTGHIDMFIKLLDDHTVLISTAKTEPYKSNAEKAISFFKDRTAPDGRKYRIITVDGWESYGAWYTYTNSLIVNGSVIMPSYSGHDRENAKAKAAYERGIPGVKVFPVNSDSSIRSGGSIHCVTQTIPRYMPAGTESGGNYSRPSFTIGSRELMEKYLGIPVKSPF